MKAKILFWAVLGVLGLLALNFLTTRSQNTVSVETAGKGILAPPFSLASLSGERVSLADFQGKVILLDFWATWCPPCQEGIPSLNQLHKEFREKGLVVIGISLDRDEPGNVQKFLEQRGVDYMNVMGTEEVFAAYSKLPGLSPIQGIPTAFIVDRQGQIYRKFVGLTKKETFIAALKSVL